MPRTPLVSKSSTMRRCSAAVPSARRNSTVAFGSSFAAASVPLRAMVQKSASLLVTNASFTELASGLDDEHADSAMTLIATVTSLNLNPVFMRDSKVPQNYREYMQFNPGGACVIRCGLISEPISLAELQPGTCGTPFE